MLVKYKAHIHVPDCENQLNYDVKDLIEVSNGLSDSQIEKKIELHLQSKDIPTDEILSIDFDRVADLRDENHIQNDCE